MRIDPAPLTTKITDQSLTLPWQTWFRNVSKNLEDSTKITSTSGAYINVNGNLLTLIYTGPSSTINLPYKIAQNQMCIFWNSDTNQLEKINLVKDSNEIIFTSNVEVNVQILIQQQNRN